MSSAAATSFTCTPGKLLNFTAVALNRSPYFSILRGLAFATTHLQPVRPRCQLNRGKLGVPLDSNVRPARHSSSTMAYAAVGQARRYWPMVPNQTTPICHVVVPF